MGDSPENNNNNNNKMMTGQQGLWRSWNMELKMKKVHIKGNLHQKFYISEE